MISIDTNILFTGLESGMRDHADARAFLTSIQENQDVMLCELVLLELYTLLRNPTICSRPLSDRQATDVIQSLRHHPSWMLIDYEPDIADSLWERAAHLPARLRIYDTRLALTLRHHGVTEFATHNVKGFQDFGFKKVWDPCE